MATNADGVFWEVGKGYYVRCVVYSVVGKLKFISDKELVFEEASYIGTDGRYATAVNEGFPSSAEIERINTQIVVNRDAINDATFYGHALPDRTQ